MRLFANRNSCSRSSQPVFGHENHWVMVGQKHGNSATTCFGYEDLEGAPPSWGLTSEKPEIKRHIMCCNVDKEFGET